MCYTKQLVNSKCYLKSVGHMMAWTAVLITQLMTADIHTTQSHITSSGHS